MDVVRSTWEESIEEYIRRSYPELRIESNNRSIIPSRNTRSSYLEIDIFIPELSLGIEANGETYHDREKYRDDRRNSTQYSDEMYKKNYCKSVGIKLIHVWSSQDMATIQRKISHAIERRLSDPTTKEWRHAARTGGLAASASRLHPIDLWAGSILAFMLLINLLEPGGFPTWGFIYVIGAWIFYRVAFHFTG